MESRMQRLDHAQLDALIRRARAQRDRELARLLGRAAKSLAGIAKGVGRSLVALYEADRERSAHHARAALRRWSARF